MLMGEKNEQKREQESTQHNLVFQNNGVIDVTNYAAETPNDSLGYLCGGIIQVLSDGGLIICDSEDETILENIKLTDIINVKTNIHNFDPRFETSVSLITNKKEIRISFQSIEIERELLNSIAAVYDKC